jgi:hypothetical protein
LAARGLRWLAAFALLASLLVQAQTSPTPTPLPPDAGEIEGGDSDPTRPVVWSLREEFYGRDDTWNNVFIFRSDRAFFAERARFPGKRGVLTRFDVPLVVAHQGAVTKAGLGDLYAQVFLVPYLTPKHAFVVGSGLTLPTATSPRLGAGKLQLAPALAPVWFFPKRGFFFLKLQDYISVAGDDDRRDLHYLTATPLMVWRLKNKPYWVQLDGETKTDFNNHNQTDYKAGFLVGRMVKRRGFWIKPEVYWGPARDADFAIKIGFFSVR